MELFEKKYCDILANKNIFLNLENPTWNRLSIGTGFHSTPRNTSTNREMFF
jgi:hypothetical protein